MDYKCDYCSGVPTEDENHHLASRRHRCNKALYDYQKNKKSLCGNRNGVHVSCDATCKTENSRLVLTKNNIGKKIIVNVKPKEKLRFTFKISNETKKYLLLLGLQLGHPQEQFRMDDHPYNFDNPPHVLKKEDGAVTVIVRFKPQDVGQFNMPIMFTFTQKNIETEDKNKKTKKDIIIIREMVVIAEESPREYKDNISPYKNRQWFGTKYVRATKNSNSDKYAIPKELKVLLTEDLDAKVLNKVKEHELDEYRTIFEEIRFIMDKKRTKENYVKFYHHLLWLDEKIAKINFKKYNMSEVELQQEGYFYILAVPGLSEKRPSLLRGDKVVISLAVAKVEGEEDDEQSEEVVEFEGLIKKTEESNIIIECLHPSFGNYYSPDKKFNVRFIMSRFPRELMHAAVARSTAPEKVCRVFPKPESHPLSVRSLDRFYNPSVTSNAEQRAAVEHIVANSSGLAPYMVYGPPGTGKTVTIVEAIIQIVARDPRAQVWVCTDSNMAADHVALQLLRFQPVLNISNFLFRASSRDRAWNILPSELVPVSNGSSYESSYSMSNAALAKYRVVVTTLLHSAKYGSHDSQRKHKLRVSHLFMDEAAQSQEPAALVALGVLAPRGQLVLAGDPRQLGPVVSSRGARDRGLGISLMEQLYNSFPNLYGGARPQHRYITMLVNNFRSHPDILEIPNEHFYEGKLKALAPIDELSGTSILGDAGGKRGIVFHGVNSKEQKLGKSPSYFNEKEFAMVKRYINALVDIHKVKIQDIGVISPYMRQVTLMKEWLVGKGYKELEVGTVEAFQGKEKRVIVVSTVRANCDLLGYDRKFDLGFLVDKKRFNVAVTRAKAKLIVIGNKSCLERDALWACFLQRCRQMGSYYGQDTEQMERTDDLLEEIAFNKFRKCRLTSALQDLTLENKDKKKKNRKRSKKNARVVLNGH